MKHYTENYLLNPNHKITINLIGAGGNGSLMLSGLARMDYALRKLGHMGLHVRMFDGDKISENNIGRQLFALSDVGSYKSDVLITRVNRFFSIDWDSIKEYYTEEMAAQHRYQIGSNIILSCVDSLKARKEIGNLVMRNNSGYSYQKSYYWMDLGNSEHTGQCILGTIASIKQPEDKRSRNEYASELPSVTEEFNDFKGVKEDKNKPSCSMAEALDRQDLFINQVLTSHSLNLLWKMFRNGVIEHRGLYVNTNTMTVNPIKI